MASFAGNLTTAGHHTYTARGQLGASTSHLYACDGIDSTCDIDFHIASMLKALARLLNESLDNPDTPAHMRSEITELAQLAHAAMGRQADAARTLRELADRYRDVIGQRDFDDWIRLSGTSRK